jgi:hypothetical protein
MRGRRSLGGIARGAHEFYKHDELTSVLDLRRERDKHDPTHAGMTGDKSVAVVVMSDTTSGFRTRCDLRENENALAVEGQPGLEHSCHPSTFQALRQKTLPNGFIW